MLRDKCIPVCYTIRNRRHAEFCVAGKGRKGMKRWMVPCIGIVAVGLIAFLIIWGNKKRPASRQAEENVTEAVLKTDTLSATIETTPVVTEAVTITVTPSPIETPEPSKAEEPDPGTSVTPEPAITEAPTAAPTQAPTQNPTKAPTKAPAKVPTKEPTQAPAKDPTAEPTADPTPVVTQEPVSVPTEEPTQEPTAEPTKTVTPIPDYVVNPGEKVTQYSGRLYGAPNKMDYSLRLIAYNRTETTVMIRIEMTFIAYPNTVHPFTHHLYWNNFDAIVFAYSQWDEPVDHSRIIQAGAKKFKFACTPETTSISIPAHFYTTDANHNPNPAEGLDLYWDLVAQLPEYAP